VELVQLYYQVGFSLKHLQMIRQEKQMIEILDKNNLTLSEQSRHDVMTGLFNRRGFMNMLEEKIGAMEIGQKAAVYFMDLDGLKQINDTYGHEEGDFAIKTTGTILSLVLSENNIGRIGGDEFLGFSMNEDVSAIIAKLENYVKSFNNKESKPYSLSMSVGYREFVKDEDTWNHISQYIEEADALLYQNKRRKKGKH
jgi:diguanylate cyclase (GGDEF)-like protein